MVGWMALLEDGIVGWMAWLVGWHLSIGWHGWLDGICCLGICWLDGMVSLIIFGRIGSCLVGWFVWLDGILFGMHGLLDGIAGWMAWSVG